MLTISAKALGRKKPLFADWSVPLPEASKSAATLRDLIGHVVRAEVADFKERQAEKRLLKALTTKEMAEGLARGKIDAGGRDLDQVVDPDQAVAVALQAFADGLYLVVLDDRELRDLDDPVVLRPDSCVCFIRMAMLAGG